MSIMGITPEVKAQIHQCVALLEATLGNELLGIWLYGSCLVGGLQKYSDIDLFVVIQRPTTAEEKQVLIKALLQISGVYMKSTSRPIEMTLVEKDAVNPWQYPPRCDFQYGEWLRPAFEADHFEPWHSVVMPDLAIIIPQVLLKSLTLTGPDPEQLLAPVPYSDFVKAMFQDLERLFADLELDTRNVLLTLARIWSTLETDAIRSKPAAADWVIARLPGIHRPVIQRAKGICTGLENEY